MARQIIIATHGYLAEGYKNTLRFLCTDINNITVISAFTDECSNPREYVKSIFEQIDCNEEILVLTDLMYGSINQLFIPYINKRNIKVITGINLPLAMELVLSTDEELDDEFILSVIAKCKNEIKYVNLETQKIRNYQEDKSKDEIDEIL